MKLVEHPTHPGIFFPAEIPANITRADIHRLVYQALGGLVRPRICAHASEADTLHEMLIVQTQDTYNRPHRHPGKVESFHVVSGECEALLYDHEGGITHRTTLGTYESGLPFFYRIDAGQYHSLIVRSHVLVVHEVTNGPWTKDDTVWAEWSVPEGRMAIDTNSKKAYNEIV